MSLNNEEVTELCLDLIQISIDVAPKDKLLNVISYVNEAIAVKPVDRNKIITETLEKAIEKKDSNHRIA